MSDFDDFRGMRLNKPVPRFYFFLDHLQIGHVYTRHIENEKLSRDFFCNSLGVARVVTKVDHVLETCKPE